MSKKKRRKAFSAPSQTTEKYIQALLEAGSSDTAATGGRAAEDFGATDSKPEEEKAIPIIKERGIPAIVWKTLIAIGIIITAYVSISNVQRFFWELSQTTNSTNEKVIDLEKEFRDFSDEVSKEQGNVKLFLSQLTGKVDRLLDKFITNRPVSFSPDSD